VAFPAVSVGDRIEREAFSDRVEAAAAGGSGSTGFDLDPIEDPSAFVTIISGPWYGAWDALKNVKGSIPNHRLSGPHT